QVLLDWVCHALTGNYSRKQDLKDDIEQKLWSFLDSILHSKKLQNLLKEGRSLNLRLSIAQVINKFFESSATQMEPKSGAGTVLSCCQGLLSTPAFAFLYTAKCELLVDLLSKLTVLACHCLRSEDPIILKLFEVLLMSLNQYIIIQRQQSNPNRTFDQVMQLFQHLLLLRHALSFKSWAKYDDSRKMIQSKSLLLKLQDFNFCEKEVQYTVIANSIPYIYKLFLDSYCKDGNQLLAKKLIYKNQLTAVPSWFNCLRRLILLNHMIIEPDLDALVLYALVDPDTLDVRVKKAQENLIGSLLEAYAKLRQLPKLFEDVLMVVCMPTTDGLKHSLFPLLSESFLELLFELPPNQILDVWAIIMEKCCSHILLDIKDDVNKSLKLISLSSLLHSLLFNMKSIDNNTPLPVIQHFQNLMFKMMDELIKPLLGLIKEHCIGTDSPVWIQKLCNATLLFIITWLEVNTAKTLNCSKYTCQFKKISIESKLFVEAWDFSPFLGDQCFWEKVLILAMLSDSSSKYYLGLLSVQKIKHCLLQIGFPNEKALCSFKAVASFVLHLRESLVIPQNSNYWEGSIITVNSDCFPVAHWHLIISNLIILHSYFSAKEIKNIADFLLETLLVEKAEKVNLSEITFENVSLSLLKSDIFAEMQVLQCAFITSIIKKCASILGTDNNVHDVLNLISMDGLNWYDGSFYPTKKGPEISFNSKSDLNENSSLCWKNMENAAQKLLSKTRFVNCGSLSDCLSDQIVDVITVIFAINPDSLTPLDQSRCFLLLLSLASDCSPRTLHLMINCYKTMAFLFTGKHSVSVFKLMYASDAVEIVMSSILKTNCSSLDEYAGTEKWLEFVDILKSYLESFFRLIVDRKQSVIINLEKITVFLLSCLPQALDTHWNSSVCQLFLLPIDTLCRVITHLLLEQHTNVCRSEKYSYLLKQVVLNMGTAVNQLLKISVKSPLLPSFLVSCMTNLLEAEKIHISIADVITKQIDTSMDKKELLNSALYQNVFFQILKELCYAENDIEFLKSSLHYLAKCVAVKDSLSQESTIVKIFTSVKRLLSAQWMNALITERVTEEISELFHQMAENCSYEEFYSMLNLALQWLDVHNLWKNYKEPFAGITVVKLFLSCTLNGDNSKLLWFSSPQIITSLVTLSKEASRNRLLLQSIVVPALEVMSLLLRQGEEFVTNPYHVTLCFDALLAVPLDHLKVEDYYSICLSIHEVLFSILQCHSKAMLKSLPSFLNSFYRLVTSVMHEGRQKGLKVAEFEVILKCVQLVARMYTHIAAKTEEFTVFSAFIVSQYINELQKVTLHCEVKKYLTEGIFHILDLCIDRDLTFLHTSLPVGVKEVFKDLYNEYMHHYKCKNQTDQKYTA
ncbi:hypothetical protein GDO86_009486, partial [Hymenochirus boettgeri]